MASFLVLYHAADLSKDEIKSTSHDGISRWLSEVSNCVVDGGQQIAEGMVVTSNGVESLPTYDAVNDYVILRARDKSEALELTRTAPTIYEGGSAEVYQISNED